MEFDKYVAAGNDFIVFNGIKSPYKDYNTFALKACDRHFGLGADGILVCENSLIADIKMLYFNSDGTQGEMCGNGIRSFSKYIYDYGIVKKLSITIETLDGIKYINLDTDELGKVNKVKVDMSFPTFEPSEIPVKINKNNIIEEIITIDEKDYKYSAVLVGVPHVVIFVEDIGEIDIDYLGRKIETHPIFPRRTNVNFVEIINSENINIYTWERGAGRTLGCGTGSCASVVIGNKIDKLNNIVNVNTEGGKLTVEIKEDDNIYMTGDAVHIAKGQLLVLNKN